MISQFFILASETPRPESARTIFADGSADESFRPGLDLELSHWVPNRTPAEFKADTSTEICLNYIANPGRRDWELAINNHQDVDGMLSIFVLTRSELALAHRETIRQAAEMGDFWAWGEPDAQRLFQGLTLRMNAQGRLDPQQAYEDCFTVIPDLLTGAADETALRPGLDALQLALERIESGDIGRQLYHDRFVHYQLPAALTASPEGLKQARRIASFNEALGPGVMLPPQARNRLDQEKVQLISIAAPDGHYYDLHYPGYAWAETPNAWRPPGLSLAGSSNVYFYSHPALTAACERLNALESASGSWVTIEHLTPFTTSLKKKYPVVLSFMRQATHGLTAAVSGLAPELVAETLAEAFST